MTSTGLLTVNGDGARRLIFIGDIHGCHDELTRLLAKVEPRPRDVVVSVGDIVRKGPAVERCLELWRERGYLAVRGNNEDDILRARRWKGPFAALFARQDRELQRRPDLIDYIRSWPVAIDFPSEGVTAVHGGFTPDMRVDAQTIDAHRHDIMRMRYVRREDGEWRRVRKNDVRKGDVLWPEVWQGERIVVYGHTPLQEPKHDRRALGIDTGCVYGRRLTAAIREDGQWRMESVKRRG